jgi:hypothetical protein
MDSAGMPEAVTLAPNRNRLLPQSQLATVSRTLCCAHKLTAFKAVLATAKVTIVPIA